MVTDDAEVGIRRPSGRPEPGRAHRRAARRPLAGAL